MDAVQPLSTALQQSLLATMLALCLLAIAWLWRDARKRETEHAAELAAVNEARLKEMQAAFAAHIATAMKIEPLALKLTECLAMVERMLTMLQQKGAAQ